ncbi:MAG: hypothetical protein ACR2OC_09865 [Solirubrobacterales bacterium]
MVAREGRTSRCSEAQARVKLEQAREYLETARLHSDAPSDSASATVGASNAVSAGIAAADAACCKALGRRSASQDHQDAAALLERIAPDGRSAATKLRRLVSEKTPVQYGVRNITRTKLATMLRQAEGLVEFAERALAR